MAEFLAALNARDGVALEARFRLSAPVLAESLEVLDGFFPEGIPELQLPPRALAFSSRTNGKIPFDLFEMSVDLWGLDCSLWAGDALQEPILHVEISRSAGSLELRYRHIGS